MKDGRQSEFVAAWKELGAIFTTLEDPPHGKGLLIQSTTDPLLFYSFGPWPSIDAVAAMRTDPRAQVGIAKVRELCVEAMPGTFRVVAESE